MDKYQFTQETRSIIEQSRMPFAMYQIEEGKFHTLAVSKGFCELFGYTSHEEAYDDMKVYLYTDTHPDDIARMQDSVRHFIEGAEKCEVIYRTKAGNKKDYRILHVIGEHVTTITDASLVNVWYIDEGPYTENSRNTDSQINQQLTSALHEESILKASYYDYLTGLPSITNFFGLVQDKRNMDREAGRIPAMLYTDFSGMKHFNRKNGFEAGNTLLKAFSEVLVRYFGKENCSRFGEDHFAIYTVSEGLEEKVRHIINECRLINDQNTLPVRVGIYLDSTGQVDVSTACDRAKYACDYVRNPLDSIFTYFNHSMLEDGEIRQYIIDHLDQAIEEKWLQVFYQPIIRASSGKVCDEEALARWIDPVRGMLSPADFIPVLEEAKLIYKLDLYMAEQILEKMKKQAADGLYVVPESVNLSRSDFDSCDIVEEIRKRVDAAGIPRNMLTIEVTESIVGSDFEFMKEQIERFQSLGFAVWMDDFGSGYSSLDTLQLIHFDVIKFDMRFMQQFNSNDKSRIILTELVRMAIGLGIDTVCEGVETLEQVEFLKEIGCTKLQGYYYNKPTPYEGIKKRYREGFQIGFENPSESEYFAAVGRINLYDLMTIANEDRETIRHYYDTIPMAIMEIDGETFTYIRCNPSFRSFLQNQFVGIYQNINIPFRFNDKNRDDQLLLAIQQCGEKGGRILIDEEMEDGSIIHAFIKRIAVNPVTGKKAVAVAFLAVMDEKAENVVITYTDIAKALSSDYINLYYVDLDTENFVEYRSVTNEGILNTERHGGGFFASSRRDALRYLYSEDQQDFVHAFTKDNVVHAIDEYGVFTLTYRLMVNNQPTYVNMKIARMEGDGHHIIVGVNNVDKQMRQQEMLERVREEQSTYARIVALSGDFVCIYTVNPVTTAYTEYSVKHEYDHLHLPLKGDLFFDESLEQGKRTIFPEDYPMFLSSFTRENVMAQIEQNGAYELQYRLMLENIPTYVVVKATIIEEKDGPQLIVGVINVDAKVKRDHEYAHNLLEARNRANLDSLTGVKNRAAFHEMEQHINHQIQAKQPVRFVLLSIRINEMEPGHEQSTDFDDCLKRACSIICVTYKRSPVFRVNDDEFVVIARGHDYEHWEDLLQNLRQEMNLAGIRISLGSGCYDNDEKTACVYERARIYS